MTKNLLEETRAIATPRVTGTNITISIALVNTVISGMKAEESERIRIRTQTKSRQNHARIDGKVLEDLERYGNKDDGRRLIGGASQPHPLGRLAWPHMEDSLASCGGSYPNPSSHLSPCSRSV